MTAALQAGERGLVAARWVRPLDPADLGTGDCDPVQVLAGRVGPGQLARGLEVAAERDEVPGRWLVYILGTRRVLSLDDAAARKYLQSWRKPGGAPIRTRKPDAVAARRNYREALARARAAGGVPIGEVVR